MKQKNQYIEISRFIGAIIIVCHHSYILGERIKFVGGWIFVEFFFMLTGYFTAAHFYGENYKFQNVSIIALRYVMKKILALVPYAWIGVLLGFISNILKHDNGGIFINCISLPYNLLLLKGCSISNNSINFNPPLWYITCILMFLPVIIILIRKFQGTYICIFSWLVPILLYAFCMDCVGKTAIWEGGVLQYCRGIADMLLGTLIYYITLYLKEKFDKKSLKFMRTVSYVLFLIFVVATIYFPNGGIELSSEITLYTFFMLIFMLADSENSIKSDTICNIVSIHLGKLSLPIYCIHYPIETIIQDNFPFMPYNAKLLLSIIITILISEIILRLRYIYFKQISKSERNVL